MFTPKPVVSVICNAYNHEKFIRQALEGLLMQRTDFPFEVLVHDDASSDATPSIILEYAQKYPMLIKPVFEKENQYSRGVKITLMMFRQCQGKYIALCEGDDYWTDSGKLQKQVDFLEKHPEASMCFHKVLVLDDENRRPSVCPDFTPPPFSDIQRIVESNFIATCSVVYRRGVLESCPEWGQRVLFGDWFMHVIAAQYGKLGYLDQMMSVYRVHAKGIWSGPFRTVEGKLHLYLKHIEFYDQMNSYFNQKYSLLIDRKRMEYFLMIADYYHILGKRKMSLAYIGHAINLCFKQKSRHWIKPILRLALDNISPGLSDKLKTALKLKSEAAIK